MSGSLVICSNVGDLVHTPLYPNLNRSEGELNNIMVTMGHHGVGVAYETTSVDSTGGTVS